MISLHEGPGSARKKTTAKVLVLRLEVEGAQPRVWRRLQARDDMWLSRLHDSIQVLFDWYDYQTHHFQAGDQRWGNPVQSEGQTVSDDRDVTLADVDLAHLDGLVYIYHFGGGWQVNVKVEKVAPAQKGVAYPHCVDGARAGPPEDCGGLEAYQDMLAALSEPASDLGREWREWLGPEYDPAQCDPDKINRALRKLGK